MKRHITEYIKYILMAEILKLFSIYPQFYRFLGNKFGTSKKVLTKVPAKYRDRARQFLAMCEKHQIVQDGDSVIEIGTGWIHFESIVLRLFYDINASLFDVWDNRHFETLKKFSIDLERVIKETMALSSSQMHSIKRTIEIISKASTFENLYDELGFKYVIDPSGTLKQFKNESYQMVYSCHVLEHVNQKIAPKLIKDFYRILKPGGFSIHKIDLTDHLVSFAGLKHISKKNYLRYSDSEWKIFFENKIQYINRIQRPEWLNLFKEANFTLVEEQLQTCNIDTVKITEVYSHLEKKDLNCGNLFIIHKKLSR